MIYSPNIKQRPTIIKELPSSLYVLEKLAPPQAIIHIGAGDGYGEMHQWRQLGVSHALIIDANEDRLEWARSLIAENSGWHAVSAVLSENEGEIDYYQASNPEEDGLISPQRLSSLWPNLRTTNQSLRFARRLDHLLAEEIGSAFEQADSIWIFVDCLPALPILRGAGTQIEQWNVLKLRVLLHPAAEIEEEAALQGIETYLQPLGFQCIEITESNHPAIGYALFARNWKTILHSRTEKLGKANAILTDEVLALVRQQEALNQDVAALNKAYEEQEALTNLHLAQIESLTQELNSFASQVVEQQAQIGNLGQANIGLKADAEALAQEKSALAAQYEALKQEVAALSQARDEQNELISQYLAQIEALMQECDNHASQATNLQAQIDALTQTNVALKADKETITQEKSVLAAQHDALKQEMSVLSMAHYEQSALADQRQKQIDTLTQTNTDLNAEKIAIVQEKTLLAAQYEALMQERDSHASQAIQLQAQINTLTQANNVLNSDKDAVIQEKSVLARQQDALKQEIVTLKKARDEQSALANQRQEQLKVLAQERSSHANLATQLQAQINTFSQTNITLKADKEALIKEKSALTTQKKALKQEVASLNKARNEQRALADQRKTQIDTLARNNFALKADKEALIQERLELSAQYDVLKQEVAKLNRVCDEQSALAHQRLAQIDTLTQDQAEQAKLVAQYKTELEQLQLKLRQSSVRITQLESKLAENNTRQHLINEEMIKAEAQIELIKDVLLREPGL